MNVSKIGFIGLGLIGGSIAKAIKKKDPSIEMIATASREATVTAAYQDSLITNNSLLSCESFADCDIIFLCSPVQINIQYLTQLKPIVKPSCIISDVGSVKGDIHEAVVALDMSKQFIGGHPMAGSEQIGYQHSSELLLENAYYILTSEPVFDDTTKQEFAAFIRNLGSIPITISPKEHDFATAAISHLPHIISASLVNLVKESDNEDELLKTIAAGGFRDITRISSSSPVMWQHICLSNPDEILHLIEMFKAKLNTFQEEILHKDAEGLIDHFTSAKEYRDSLPIHTSGVIPKVHEFYCDLIDEAGGIATIATILATNQLSIKNIGIINNREFEDGVLRIEMYDEESLANATALLTRNHYTIYVK